MGLTGRYFKKHMSHIQNDLLFIGTADKTVTNTTSDTSAVPTGVGSTTVQADWWQVGRVVRITAHGVYSTPAITGGTATVKVKIGSTTIASVSTSALLTGASSLGFYFEVLMTCRAVGASGSISIGGAIGYQVASSARVYDMLDNGAAVVTVDTTASAAIDVTVAWDTAAVTKIVKVTNATLELLE